MPVRLLPRLSLTLLATLLFASFVVALDANEGVKESLPDGPAMRVENRDGSTFAGKLVQSIRLKTEYGSQQIDAKHIKRITFRPPGDEQIDDNIDLNDKTHMRGKIEDQWLQFVVDDQLSNIAVEKMREVKSSAQVSVSTLSILAGLLTLTAMEIVLGIDNVIFLAIIAGRLPREQQPRARRVGLIAALGTRLLLLATLSFLLGLTRPLFTLPDLPLLHNLEAREVSLRDLILIIGGLFLIGKSVMEVHEKFEAAAQHETRKSAPATSFIKVLIQIAIIDIVFSLDSVITAVGMVEELWVMIVAMVVAMLVMLVFAGRISEFVVRHPTVKILALAFLILIGVMLVAEALGQHMDKGYIYFAMAFAVVVEMINLRLRRKPASSGAAST